MAIKKTVLAQEAPEIRRQSAAQQPFGRINYICMGGCIALIVVGFLLMCGSSSSVEGGFNPDIFSTRRIVVGPLLAFLGFLLMAFAIVISPDRKRGKSHEAESDTEKVDNDGMA